MRKVWGIFNKQKERADEQSDRQDSPRTGQGALSNGSPAVRTGGSEEGDDPHGAGAVFGEADNSGSSLQLPFESGERFGRDVRLRCVALGGMLLNAQSPLESFRLLVLCFLSMKTYIQIIRSIRIFLSLRIFCLLRTALWGGFFVPKHG